MGKSEEEAKRYKKALQDVMTQLIATYGKPMPPHKVEKCLEIINQAIGKGQGDAD